MIRLSIIIPVFNVEDYISKCILSLEDQDIPRDDYEIVIINDGSPDNSRDVVMDLMKTYHNIVFIEQENKGVSIARNVGIDRARGNYLVFIDPDDYVLPKSLSRVLDTAEQSKAQISFLGYQYLNEDNSLKASFLFSEYMHVVHTGTEAYHLSLKGITKDPDRSVAIIYDRDYLNSKHLRFTPKIPYLEDGEFLARVLCLADRCIFEGHPFYIRTTRQGSATNSNMFFSDRAIDGFFNAASNLKKFKSTHVLSSSQKKQINQPITKFTLLIVQACVGEGMYAKYRVIKKRLKATRLDKMDIKGCSSFYYKYGLIFNISSDLFYFVWGARLLFMSLNNKMQNSINRQ
jgi:glycosyltransferase involved in cell wall biosynthesis